MVTIAVAPHSRWRASSCQAHDTPAVDRRTARQAAASRSRDSRTWRISATSASEATSGCGVRQRATTGASQKRDGGT